LIAASALEVGPRRRRAALHLSPVTTDPRGRERLVPRFEGAGLDGVIAKPSGATHPGKRTLLKVKHQRTADVVVGGFRWHKDGEGVGSLLLGLYDDDDRLRHIGVAASFSAAAGRARRRARRSGRPRPRCSTTRGSTGRATASPRGPSRWSTGKDTSWEPLRLGLVAEVAYEQLQGDRLRHGARFLRWRPTATRPPAATTSSRAATRRAAELFDVRDHLTGRRTRHTRTTMARDETHVEVDGVAGAHQLAVEGDVPRPGVDEARPRRALRRCWEGALRGVYGRPTVLKRFNQGWGEPVFQKRAPKTDPAHEIATVRFPSGRSADMFVPRRGADVVWLAQQNCIDLNPWPVRAEDLDHPDELRIDLDPTPGRSTFADVRRVALEVRGCSTSTT
jgi:hypothetical protein